MTTLPLWAVYAVAFGSPLLTFLGVLLALWLTRKTAHELDARAGREELMRNLRWAVELAADQEEAKREAGVRQLRALGESELFDPRDQVFIDAALRAVNQQAQLTVSRQLAADHEPDVVELADLTAAEREGPGVSFRDSDEDGSAR